MTDVQVRAAIGAPSIDCLVQVMRLRYLHRLVTLQPPDLVAILHMRPGGTSLPWVRCVAADCDSLRARCVGYKDMPSFLESPLQWSRAIADSKQWLPMLDSPNYLESVFDTRVARHQEKVLAHKCFKCTAAFASQRALASHTRAMHHVRSCMIQFLHATQCPACGTEFYSRIRLLAHLSHSARPTCPAWVKRHVQPMTPAKIATVRAELTTARRSAQQAGRTQVRATTPAKRK